MLMSAARALAGVDEDMSCISIDRIAQVYYAYRLICIRTMIRLNIFV